MAICHLTMGSVIVGFVVGLLRTGRVGPVVARSPAEREVRGSNPTLA